MVDELLRGQFISGLYDQDVQSKVKLDRSLGNFVDVVSFARHIEQHNREMQVLRGWKTQPQQSLPDQGTYPTTTTMLLKQQAPPPTCWTCGKVGHWSNTCPSKAQGEAQLSQNQVSSNCQLEQRRVNLARQTTAHSSVPAASNMHQSLFADYLEREPVVNPE
uniref:CCHC-type domain-containing protein n=1 Tax=Plectus sambesii TaxID=2011161 RepID=A0A914UKD4_9BILA